MFFKKAKETIYESMVEQRFDQIMGLVRDLPPKEYRKLKEAMDMCYNGYQKLKKVQGENDEDVNEIADIEKVLSVESGKEEK